MSQMIASNNISLVVGLGATGLSIARYLASKDQQFCVVDEQASADRVQQFLAELPDAKIALGPIDFSAWQGVSRIIISPGFPRSHDAIQQALAAGVEVIGDIELFAREVKAPVVAITGSNGKTTVTSLLGEMAKFCGVKVAVGGNIGTPALDLLDDSIELYILELSSFQLESTVSLEATVATVLNVSQDHLDRYANLHEYFLTKQIIYHRAKNIVVNKDDVFTQPPVADSVKVTRFGKSVPDLKDFGVRTESDGVWLCHGLQKLLRADDLRIRGTHNVLNALACLALGNVMQFPMEMMLESLKHFSGLPHRCQFVKQFGDITYINDSKATNVGATVAALKGLASGKNIVLLAGGEGKGADFSELREAVAIAVKQLILFGKDADLIASSCESTTNINVVTSLNDALNLAYELAEAGDIVLLSPACASMDMFKNYQDRGQQFCQMVEDLCQA